MADSDADLFQQAFDHHLAGRLAEARALYHHILDGTPGHPDVLYLLGAIAHQNGQSAQAVEWVRRSLAIVPDQARCYNLLGLDLSELGKPDEAESCFLRAIALEDSSESYNNLGIFYKQQGRFDEAAAMVRKALELDPASAAARYNLGNVFRAGGAWESAAECFRHAIELDPEHAHALSALGQVLQKLSRDGEATPFLRRAIAQLPADPELYCDLGDALQSLGQFGEASTEYRRALQLDARLARAWYSAGCAESSRKEYSTAMACFRRALEIRADWPQAQHNLGQVLFHLGQQEEAIQRFRQAGASGDPSLPLQAIAVMIPGDAGSDNQAILDARRQWAERQLPSPAAAQPPRAADNRPLRIGYVSSFFADHNWMKPVWGLINHHDRERFEIHLFSDAPASQIQYGYRAHCRDRFHDTTGLSNEALAQRIGAAGIDVLVDLNGYSNMRRLPLFALRPAPLIVGWFNMYATTGMPAYHCLIGDCHVIPPQEEQFYCERIIRVPGSYLTFEVAYPVPDVSEPPCLKNGAITFGCLAPQYKITSQVIAAWSDILHQVPQSSLVLRSRALGSAGVRQFVLSLFEGCRIDSERIRMEGPTDHYGFLATYSKIDIALDTFPYNGGTTTTEAIWQGVPVVAFSGDRWVSRTSASILLAAGLNELVGQNLEDYVATAVRLAHSPGHLLDIRRTMRSHLQNSPVCDTLTFARNMEQIYTEQAGMCST